MQTRLAAILTILLFLAGCGAPSATPTPAPRPTLPGDKIDVGGYRLYLDCKGEGSPAIILEAGLEGDATTWKDAHPEVAKLTRVCRYDRAGLTHSDYGPTPRNAELTTQDLYTLLSLANISSPYILVGHSFGGLLIRRYQHDFPEEVTGMIFVDAVYEDWWEQALAIFPSSSPDEPARPTSFRLYLTAGWRDPANKFEAMDIPAVVAQVRENGSLGDLPVTVLTAENFTVLNPGLPPNLEQTLANLFKEQQTRLAALSTNSRQSIVPRTGHNIPTQNPAVVVEAIRAILEGQ